MRCYPPDLKTTTRRMILTAIHIKWVNPIYKLFYIKIKIKIKETYIKLNPKYCSKRKKKSKFLSLPLTNFLDLCEFSSSRHPPLVLNSASSHPLLHLLRILNERVTQR